MKTVLVMLAATLMGAPCFAQQPAKIIAQDAWARATTPGVSTGGVYVTLTSPAGDRLVGVTSPASAAASVHEMQMEGTIMRMRALDGGLPLPAGQAVTLKPSGYHIMLEGLRSPLLKGSAVPVRLQFQTAPAIDILVPVQSIGATGPGDGHDGHAAMPGMSMPK